MKHDVSPAGNGAFVGHPAVRRLGASAVLSLSASPLAAVCLIAATSVAAQPVPPLGSAEADPAPYADDNEIIVTAQRRQERLEDVPMSIAVVSGERFEKSGLSGMFDLGQVSAGVIVNAGTQAAPTIRGVTSLTFGGGIEGNVAVYVDGFYEPSTFIIGSDLPNIASVEILKGPQGTLYGRNATGGAILINTLRPSETLTGRIKASYGNFDDARLSAYLSGPLSEKIRFGVAGYYRKTDGFIKLIDPVTIGKTVGNAAPKKQASIRTKLEADLSDGLTATLGYNYVYTSDPLGQIFSTIDYVPVTLPPPPGRITKLGTAALNTKSVNRTRKQEGTLTLVYTSDGFSITSRTGYSDSLNHQRNDLDGTYANNLSNAIDGLERTFQQSLDANLTFIDGLDLLVGISYFHNDAHPVGPNLVTVKGPNSVILNYLNTTLKTEAFAGYIDGTVQLAPDLSLTLGGRYTYETKDASAIATTPAGAIVSPFMSGHATYRKFTPRASIRYTIAPRTNIYASWTRGFRSGNFPTSGAVTAALYVSTLPEDITSYEVGFKTAGDVIRFDTSAFYYDYSNIQVSGTVPRPGCTNCGIVSSLTNAKASRIYGAEAQLTITPDAKTTFWAGASLLNARYKDFANATGTGLSVANLNALGQMQDWTGLDMVNSPEFTANFGASHEMPLARGALLVSGNGSYTSSFVRNPSVYGPAAGALARVQRYRIPKYMLLNAWLSWTDPSEKFTLAAYANNIANKDYFFRYDGNASGDYKIIGSPRAYGAEIELKF